MQRTAMRDGIRWGFLAIAVLAVAARPVLADRPPFTIEPGPRTMTPEEAALLPDASVGMQHAVVLVDDTLRDDKLPELGRHLRVKVFSREWRGVGDFEIPYEARTLLKKFWTHIIPPRGPATEVGVEDLVEQVVARRGGFKVRVLKLVLPRVVPGTVLDIGYIIRDSGEAWTRIPLQQPWPVRHLRYWWAPELGTPSQYHVRRRPGLKAIVTPGKESVFLEATDLPLFVEEPWSPPDDLIRAGAVFHYTFDQPNKDPNVFWNDVSRSENEETTEFLKDKEPLRALIDQMKLPATGTIDEKLRAAYEWIEANIRNTWRLTSEEMESMALAREIEGEKAKKAAFVSRRKRGTIQDILDHHEAHPDTLDRLFLGVARSLGAQAHLVLVPNRVYEFWERTLFSTDQFSDQVVAVGAPGELLDRSVFVDSGSGLPYGHVGWELTATKALVVTTAGSREVIVPFDRADFNLLQTQAALSFNETTGAGRVAWSAAGRGQRGLEERESLRFALADRRQIELRELCGEGADMEVSRAVSPGLEKAAGAHTLECEGDLAETGPAPAQRIFSFHFNGKWIPTVPALLSPERIHPVVLSYPWKDHSLITVSAPAGFVPGSAPRDVILTSPFGGYRLAFRVEAGAFHVERSLSITTLTARPEEYKALRKFLQDVRRTDEIPLTFRREGSGL